MKKITVVTVTYNTHLDTLNFIHSLELVEKVTNTLELIIIDNGSETPFIYKKHLKGIKSSIIHLKENIGFVGGYNLGISYALKNNSDYIMIVNNDTLLRPDTITNLAGVLESNSKIGITVPKIYFAKGHEFYKEKYKKEDLGKVLWYAGGYVDWANAVTIHRGVDEVDFGQYDTIEKIDFATGCCMMIKKEVIKKIGIFDTKYFLYYEDADLSERVKKAHFQIYYVPTALLIHVNASSSGGIKKGNTLQDYFITRNKMLFGMTYAPFRTKLALIRLSLKLLISGRPYQKRAIQDFYMRKLNKGTFWE